MKAAVKTIFYWAIDQSIIKILVGAVLLFDNSQGTLTKDYDVKRDQLYPGILVMIGFVGVFCSLQLKVGIRKSSLKHLFWWIVYQFVAIAHQVVFYSFTWWILKDSPVFQSVWKLLLVLTVTHICQEIFFLSTILNLLFQINQQQREAANLSPERVEEGNQSHDKPPSYDEVVGFIV